MNLPQVTPQQLDEDLRPFLDQLERDFKMRITYSYHNYEEGCDLRLIFTDPVEAMSPEAFEQRMEQAMKLMARWVEHWQSSLGLL